MIMRVFASALFAVAIVIPPALADEREDAYASIERWSEAFNSGDVEQIVRMYTSDALVLGTFSPGMTTKSDDLRAYFKAAAAAKLL
jgi:ketosteroid isomerase-like protein